ncbi:MAG: DUF6259 domain-containing protein [Planctomycetota bacterium]
MLTLASRLLPLLALLALSAPLSGQCPAWGLFDSDTASDAFGADVDLIADLAVIGDPLQGVLHVATESGGLFNLADVIYPESMYPPFSSGRFGAQVELKYYDWGGAVPGPSYVPCSAEIYASAPDDFGAGLLYRVRGGTGFCGWTHTSRVGYSLGTVTDPVIGAAKVGESLSSWGYRLAVGAPDNHGGRGSAYLLNDFDGTSVSCNDLYYAAVGPWITFGNAHIGTSVAINERWALVGAPGETGSTGFVWVFERAGASWTYHSSLPSVFPDTRQGLRIALHDDRALVSHLSPSGYRSKLYTYQGGSSWSLETTLGAGLAGALTDDRAVLFEVAPGTTFQCADVPVRPYYRKPDGSWVAGPSMFSVPYASVSDLVCAAEISGETVLVGSKGQGCGSFISEGAVIQRNLACFSGSGDDCNGNGLPDSIDIYLGDSEDCNGDDYPDECVTPLSVSTDAFPSILCTGDSAEVVAYGSGSLPMTFTWYDGPVADPVYEISPGYVGPDGTEYEISQSGSTSHLQITNFLQSAPAGGPKLYTVVVESGTCTASTTTSYLDGFPAPPQPIVTLGSVDCLGSTLTLESHPTGYNHYEWIQDGAWLGQHAPSLQLDLSAGPAIFGDYQLLVYGDGGCEAISAPFTLDADAIAPLLSVTASPSHPAVCAGKSTEVAAQGVGALPMTFTWYEGPVADPAKEILSGSTGGDGTGYAIEQVGTASYLTLSDFQQYAATAVTTTYTVVVESGGCSATATASVEGLTAPIPPLLTLSGAPACPDGMLTLSVPAIYDDYDWIRGGTWVAGGSPTLKLDASAAPAIFGDYHVLVYGEDGCDSTSNTLTIDVDDVLSVPAISLTGSPSCPGLTSLELSAPVGYGQYAWHKDGSPLPGETSHVLTLATLDPAAVHGSYTVQVGSATQLCAQESNPVEIDASDFVPQPEIQLGGTPTCPGETDITMWVSKIYDSYQWLRDGLPVSGAAFAGANGHQLTIATDVPSAIYGDYTVQVSLAGAPCTVEAVPVPLSSADILSQPCELFISNGTVDLAIKPDPDYGLVHEHLLNLTVTGPAGPGDGVFFAPSDVWKVTLRSKDFAGMPVSTASPCDPQPADGLLHIRASDVTVLPVLSVGPTKSAPTEMRARWSIHPDAIETLGDADFGTFPLEPFVVELIYKTSGDNDYVGINLNVRLTGADPRLSVYRLELRTAAELTSAPQNHMLAAPWYFGVLLPDPLNSGAIEFADCLADIRLSDPVHGKSIPTHPGVLTMQWMSFYETDDPEGDLLYWGTRDTGNHIKPYFVYPEQDGLGFGVQYQPIDNLNVTGQEDADGDGEPDGVSMPFDVVMTALKGDWYDAAQYYRDWAIDPSWVWIPDALPGDPGSDYSQLIYDAQALGTVNIAPCEPAVAPELAPGEDIIKDYTNFQFWQREWDDFEAFFGLTSLVGRPWFWDHNAFDAAFGEWMPVRDDFLAACGTVAHPWGPYFHPLIVDRDSPGYASSYVPEILGEDLERYVVKDEFGQAHRSSIFAVPKDQGCGPHPIVEWHQRVLCPASSPDPEKPAETVPLLYARHVLGQLAAAMTPFGGSFSGAYLDEYHHLERVCYDASHGHPVGGDGSYFVDGKQVLSLLLKQWMRDNGNPEPFLWTEGASEPYVGFVEVCNLSYGQVFGSDLEESAFDRAPMFQTVYNEYQRFASVLPANLPLSDTVSAEAMAASRHFLARYSSESGEVALGTVLSPKSLADNLDHPLYAQAAYMVQDFAQVLNTDEARDLLRFGQRFRNPRVVANFTGPEEAPLFLPPGGGPPPLGALGSEQPKESPGPSYPAVYGSVCGHRSEKRVAVLLLNWTAAEDLLTAPTLVADTLPGDQIATVTLDPASYGFEVGDPLQLRNVRTGEVSALVWSGGTVDFATPVAQTSAALFELSLP